MWINKYRFVVFSAFFGLLCLVKVTNVDAQHSLRNIRSDSATYLQPGDVVRLSVWREPDLSGEFIVAQNGEVVFPKIGIRAVTSFPVDSVRALLIGEYQKFLENPSITVQFLWRIKVVGAVMKPGIYPVDPSTSVTDAIAIAGGVSPIGRSDRVELVRDGVRTVISLANVHPLLNAPVQSGDEIVVPQNGWFARNPAIFPISISALASLLAIILR